MNVSRAAAQGRGLVVAAPSSGSGKTVVTLGLLRAMKRRGTAIMSAKAGPDYIDPKFHAAATGADCVNLDPWAMRPQQVQNLYHSIRQQSEIVLIEGMMGLFDGAADGTGSAADLSVSLGLPVVLIVDVSGQSQSVAALVRGFMQHRSDVTIAGVILNRVGSVRHETMLRQALAELDVAVLGAVPRDNRLFLPSRHLGLVQAGEHGELEGFLDTASRIVGDAVDLDGICAVAGVGHPAPTGKPRQLTPLGQRTAVACDEAFAFAYPHVLTAWRNEGCELSWFSPLKNEAPAGDADSVYLPGGYPELHAKLLSANEDFLGGLRGAAAAGKKIYGECGGYMVLGRGLTDAEGASHVMAGLLPLETSFAHRKLHLGYRRATPLASFPWEGVLAAHEFHYASIVAEGDAQPLFATEDATGESKGQAGLVVGTVGGSFMHVVDITDA